MLQIALWKRVLIWAACAAGLLMAAPNLFYERVERHNDAIVAIEAAGGQASAEQAADAGLWPGILPSSIVNLGLDLRGGAHLLAEVRLADVYGTRMDGLWPEVRDALRAMEERKGKLEALRAHLSEGATQASNGDFVDDFSMDSLISDLDAES